MTNRLERCAREIRSALTGGSAIGDAIQVHGEIDFTWEHDLPLYFKLANYLEFALRTPAQCPEIVAAPRVCGYQDPASMSDDRVLLDQPLPQP